MTINLADNTPRVVYSVAEGVTQTTFTVPFEFFESSDVSVYVDDIEQTEGSNYTVTGGDGSTGSITFSGGAVTGATGGSKVVLFRRVPLERTSDFNYGADINRGALNEQLDVLTAIAADLKDAQDRSLHVNDYENGTNLELPTIAARKGNTLAFNATTGDPEAGPSVELVEEALNNFQGLTAFIKYNDLIANETFTYTAGSVYSVSSGDTFETIDSGNWEVAASGASDHHVTTAGGVKLYEAGPNFSTRARMVSRFSRMTAASETPPVGSVWSDGTVSYTYDGTTTAISDMSGWALFGDVYLDHFAENTTPGSTDMQAAISAAKAADAARGSREPIILSGKYAHSEPIISDNERSVSFVGGENSNLNDPASTTEYTGTGVTATVTSATNADPAVFTATSHGLSNGDVVWFKGVSGGTWQGAISGGPWTVANSSTNTFTIADANGTALDGTSLGTLSGATARTPAAMAGWYLTGAFAHTVKGAVLRTTQAVESILRIDGNIYLDSTDFSSHINTFSGVQFAPKTNDVTDGLVVVANTKFTNFENCWWSRGPTDATKGLTLGINRDDRPNTLMSGVAGNTRVNSNFIFNDVVLVNAVAATISNCQFDATVNPVRLRTSGDNMGALVSVHCTSFTNDGGADGSGLPALTHEYSDIGSSSILPSHGWETSTSLFRDWPIGMQINGGHHSVRANIFRAQSGSDVGIVIGPNAYGESIDQTNSFLMMLRNSAVGIEDQRYAETTITGATQADPVVITTSGGHTFNDGDRVLIENVSGMTELNGNEYVVQNGTATTFELHSITDGGTTSTTVDGTGFTAYTSGGTVRRPYMWHMNTDGPQDLIAGHSDMICDLELNDLLTLSSGTNTVFDQDNVMLTGGHYEVTLHSTVIINSTGRMRFKVTVDGTDLKETHSAFVSNDTAEEVSHNYTRRFHIPASTSNKGVRVRLIADAPGGNQLRGRASGTLGTTFMQIRRVA